jgi:hypothetical protein
MAAAYLLWLCCWLILGNTAFGEDSYFWDQTASALAAALAAFAAAWRAVRPYSVFMAAQGLGLTLLAASWAAYDPNPVGAFSTFSQVSRRLEHVDGRAADPRVATTLQSAGLGAYLDSLNQSARTLKQDVLFQLTHLLPCDHS